MPSGSAGSSRAHSSTTSQRAPRSLTPVPTIRARILPLYTGKLVATEKKTTNTDPRGEDDLCDNAAQMGGAERSCGSRARGSGRGGCSRGGAKRRAQRAAHSAAASTPGSRREQRSNRASWSRRATSWSSRRSWSWRRGREKESGTPTPTPTHPHTERERQRERQTETERERKPRDNGLYKLETDARCVRECVRERESERGERRDRRETRDERERRVRGQRRERRETRDERRRGAAAPLHVSNMPRAWGVVRKTKLYRVIKKVRE